MEKILTTLDETKHQARTLYKIGDGEFILKTVGYSVIDEEKIEQISIMSAYKLCLDQNIETEKLFYINTDIGHRYIEDFKLYSTYEKTDKDTQTEIQKVFEYTGYFPESIEILYKTSKNDFFKVKYHQDSNINYCTVLNKNEAYHYCISRNTDIDVMLKFFDISRA